MVLYLAMLVPIVCGAALPLLRLKREGLRGLYVTAVTLAASALVLTAVWRRSAPAALPEIYPGVALAFRVDELSRYFLVLIALLWPLATLYGVEYIRHEERPDAFFAWYIMSNGVTVALATSANLLTMYVCFELLTLTTLPLVTHHRDDAGISAGRSYAVYSLGGAALGFCALCVTHYLGAGSFAYGGALALETVANNTQLLRWLYILGFVGFGTKAAVLPMSAWLPEASTAPTPVTALLHAVAVVNAGAYAVIRLTWYVIGPAALVGSLAQKAALGLACATILLGSAMACREQHLKRRLAWSTVSNLSYMLMGVALMTPAGLDGALTHFLYHSLMKIALFFCAGAFMVQSGQAFVRDMRGFARAMPLTCAAFTAAAVALVGTPPFVGFVSKWRLLTAAAAMETGMGMLAVAALIVSSVLTAVYLLTVVMAFYFRPLNADMRVWGCDRQDPTWRMLVPLGVICTLILGLGIWGEPLLNWLRFF